MPRRKGERHVPFCFLIYNTSLSIMQSTFESRRNTGPLFEGNGQHRSWLTERFIILADSISRRTVGLCTGPRQTHTFNGDKTTSTHSWCFLIPVGRGQLYLCNHLNKEKPWNCIFCSFSILFLLFHQRCAHINIWSWIVLVFFIRRVMIAPKSCKSSEWVSLHFL